MIITKITSGLGNQMFQYALGRALSLYHHTILKLDISVFDTYKGREYGLKNFCIQSDVAMPEEIETLKNSDSFLKKYLSRYEKKVYLKERHFWFDAAILKTGNPAYLNGYWQSEKYFVAYADTIRNDFRLKNPLPETLLPILYTINSTESVAVHIRRGDYVSNPLYQKTHGALPVSYYQNAVSILDKKLKNPVFYIFSDDMEWVKNNLTINHPVYHIEGNKDYEDLYLISLCKHQIIANSSFSWWGAWLNQFSDKIIIAPERWFAGKKFKKHDLLPELWIKI